MRVLGSSSFGRSISLISLSSSLRADQSPVRSPSSFSPYLLRPILNTQLHNSIGDAITSIRNDVNYSGIHSPRFAYCAHRRKGLASFESQSSGKIVLGPEGKGRALWSDRCTSISGPAGVGKSTTAGEPWCSMLTKAPSFPVMTSVISPSMGR